ncbi:MAG: secretion protein EspK [Mycobacteriaceae bacterium]|nr:secretion protein EspK [Mycobacteriaceae bacterium]
MGIEKPIGGHAEQMLDPGGWPEVDEDAFYDRATEFTRVLRRVSDVMETCQQQQARVFDEGVWSGGAAVAANGAISGNINQLLNLQNNLAAVITWHKYIGGSVALTKSTISDNVDSAQRKIHEIQHDSSLDDDERESAINKVVSATRGANLGVMAGAAEQIRATTGWRPPDNALDDLLDQKAPPEPETLDEEQYLTLSGPPQSTAVLSPPASVDGSASALNGSPTLGAMPPRPASAPPQAEGAQKDQSDASQSVLNPAASTVLLPGTGSRSNSGSKGVTPAAVGTLPDEAVAPTQPAATSGLPPASMAPAAAAAAAGSGTAPVGNKPGGATRGNRSGTSAAKAAEAGTTERAESADRTRAAADIAPVVAVPVSAIRAERDAVVEAATAGAVRRAQGGGPDPVQVARHIAAALNAPDSGDRSDFGFFWITAVTIDGKILVANSYGLGYIPSEVQLPPSVQLVTADERIPVEERASWATYPGIALQGWATYHNTELRVVIGTQEQLANSDAGVATIVLEPEDIPESGQMTGRSRLQVVDSPAAARLAGTSDMRSVDLLPPKKADAQPPEDRRFRLWFNVMKPMTSTASGREKAHLRALHAYVAHAQEVVYYEAYAATEPVAQRAAVGDWLYLNYLNGLLAAALPEES